VTSIQGIYRTAHILLALLLAVPAAAQICSSWKESVRVGQLKTQLEEASGVAASRQFPGRLYHINDSGSVGSLFITDMDGGNTRSIRIDGFQPGDTEALSLGPCPGGARGACIYIADIGDNDKGRKAIQIIVVEEVQNFAKSIAPRNRILLRYPDGSHDAESMAVHPDGTIYILTKERPAKLFKVEVKTSPATLTAVTTLNLESSPTDMAISDDGSRLLVLTYADAVEYSMDFKQRQKIPLNFLQQQESVTYLPGSRSFIYTSERLLALLPQYIMRADCDAAK
jgi:hypothetical protein